MWRERIDDKVKAEGIANRDYSMLFVDRGTVIIATRDYKPLNFREIVEYYKIPEIDKFVQPHPFVGGWRKFIRTTIAVQKKKETKKPPTKISPRKRKTTIKKGRKRLASQFLVYVF